MFDNCDVPETDNKFNPDSYDQYLQIELVIDRGDKHPETTRVTKRLKNHRGNSIGTTNNNPIMDSRLYEIEFADGHK